MNWGRKKQMCIVTLQGDLTEKQFLKIQKAMLKIIVKHIYFKKNANGKVQINIY